MAIDPNWRPKDPYIMFMGRERMTSYGPNGERIEKESDDAIMFFPITGSHMNEESINMLRSKGWSRIIEYGNFPNTDKWRAFANYLESQYPFELKAARKEKDESRRRTSKGAGDNGA